jgi:hypothetical protein
MVDVPQMVWADKILPQLQKQIDNIETSISLGEGEAIKQACLFP